jgi:hypothetical protein
MYGRERESYTLELGKWCMWDLRELGELLIAYANNNHPRNGFDESSSMVADYNPNSGNVFLWSEDWSGSLLYREYTRENACAPTKEAYAHYSSPYRGDEGDWGELCGMFFGLHPEDQEWFFTLPEYDHGVFCKEVEAATVGELEEAWDQLYEYAENNYDSNDMTDFIQALSPQWGELSDSIKDNICDWIQYNRLETEFPLLTRPTEQEEEDIEEEENESNTGEQSADSTTEPSEDCV